MTTHMKQMLILSACLSMPAVALAQTPAKPSTSAAPVASAQKGGTQTAGTVEVGVGDVTSGDFKAGEFNGLQKKGAYVLGFFDLRGGGTYDSDNALRWRIRGSDLGLETRNVTAEIGVQGKFRLTGVYDEFLRNRSDTYQTPYNGAGTNTLTLPNTWMVPYIASSSATNNRGQSVSARGLVPFITAAAYIDTQTGSATIGKLITPNATQLALFSAVQAADLPLFHNVNLSTKRTTGEAGFTAAFTPEFGVDVNVKMQHKSGMRPMGTVSRNTGGDIATIIPDLIDTDTSHVSGTVGYRGDDGNVQAGYYGSFFTNHVASMSWMNWATGPTGTGTVNQMGSAPSNTYHQFFVEANRKLSTSTRLVAHGSYGRSTQNDTFLTDSTTPVVPVNSLNGLIVNSQVGARLTSRQGKVNLTAAYKFDNHDNQTGVHLFQYADTGEAPAANANFPASTANTLGAVLAQNANANRPYSRKSQHASLDADYQFIAKEWLKGAYDFERINRSCTGTWIACADAGTTNEHTLKAEWRGDFGATLNMRVDSGFARRRTPNYNENAFLALVPYANISPASAIGGATALSFMLANGWTGYGPVAGYTATTGNNNLFFPSNNALANATYANNNRISELIGMRRYYVSDRDRNTLRSMLSWMLSEQVTLGGGVNYTGDTYTDAIYGMKSHKSCTSNVDLTFDNGDGLSATLFYTFQNARIVTNGNSYTANNNTANVNTFTALSGNSCDSYTSLQQRNNNNKIDPCLDWSANMNDKVATYGLTVGKKTEKVNVWVDAVISDATSTNTVTGGSWSNNPLALTGAPVGTVAAYFIAATPLPDVTTKSTELRANGIFTVTERQSLRLIYAYLRMRNADWVYDGMQIGAGTIGGVLPTNEQPFNYNVHVLAASYVISFK